MYVVQETQNLNIEGVANVDGGPNALRLKAKWLRTRKHV